MARQLRARARSYGSDPDPERGHRPVGSLYVYTPAPLTLGVRSRRSAAYDDTLPSPRSEILLGLLGDRDGAQDDVRHFVFAYVAMGP
jgi:hypothetical protein